MTTPREPKPDLADPAADYIALFHVTSELYLPGEVKQPGAWGLIIQSLLERKAHISNKDAIMLLVEMALETTRISQKPHAPSRLSCIYAWDKLEDAERFRILYRPDAFIYLVEPEGSRAAIHRNDIGILYNPHIASDYLRYISVDSIRYWTSEPSGLIEVLIGGPVRILGVVSTENTDAALHEMTSVV